jgi:hypothetical protein
MDYRSLYTAYRANPQEPETSREVVRFWHNPQVRYKDEEFSLEARECCLRRVAERIVHRRILGLDGLETEHAKKAFRVEVFGKGSPLLSELLLPDVFVAMAFVPLTPGESSTNKLPRLARLYCVSGLGGQKRLPFQEGTNEPVLDKYSWFIEGISDRERISGVEGRSWLLAAHILSKIVGRKDKKTACNLAKHYIVTGDVQGGGNICKVEMGRKEELASQKWFANFKWIIPKENDMNIHKRKIEKPETLEEAYKLIESMRNTATKSFFRFLRKGDFPGVKEQCRIGADLFAREEDTDFSCLEVLSNEKARLYAEKKSLKKVVGGTETEDEGAIVDLESYKRNVRDRIATLDKISLWLRLQGADSAMTFYLMAVNGDEEGIIRTSAYTSINACDEHGLTAVDFALIGEKFEVARLLHRYGGVPNSRWGANRELGKAISCLCHPLKGCSTRQVKLIVNAIEVGLSPETEVYIPRYDCGGFESARPGLDCTLFASAVRHANYEVIEVCLKCGADANKKLLWTTADVDPWGEPYEAVEDQGTPWSVLSARKDMTGEKRQKFRELLLRYGANISEE